MKNIREKQKKTTSPVKSEWIWTVLMIVVCIAGTFGVTSTFYRNAAKTAEANEVPMISVAAVNAEVPQGSTIDGSYGFVSIPQTQVPENAVVSGTDISGQVSSIKLLPNTILTTDMLVHVDMDEIIDDTSRQVAVNYVSIATNLVEGDFVDVRMKAYSTEQLSYSDDVVLAKKKILAVQGSTIYLNLSEEEQLRLGIAAVDVSLRNSNGEVKEKAMLYATAYANGSQSKAIVTYQNSELKSLLEINPQMISQAQKDLALKEAQNQKKDSNVEIVAGN